MLGPGLSSIIKTLKIVADSTYYSNSTRGSSMVCTRFPLTRPRIELIMKVQDDTDPREVEVAVAYLTGPLWSEHWCLIDFYRVMGPTGSGKTSVCAVRLPSERRAC